MIDFVSDSSDNVTEKKVLQILNTANILLQYSIDNMDVDSIFDQKKLESEIMNLITTENLLYDILHHRSIPDPIIKSNVLNGYLQIKEIRLKKYFQYLLSKNI